jgi:hypothetical protein
MTGFVTIYFFNSSATQSKTKQHMNDYTTHYYDMNGRQVGSSQTKQHMNDYTTHYYDMNGSQVGSSQTKQHMNDYTTHYYDRNGSQVGSSQTRQYMNDYTTHYYDMNSREVGSSQAKQYMNDYTTGFRFKPQPENKNEEPQYPISELKLVQNSPAYQPKLFKQHQIPSLNYRNYPGSQKIEKKEESCCSCLIL